MICGYVMMVDVWYKILSKVLVVVYVFELWFLKD